jgi:excisionase family DNA binding protein
MSRKPTRRPQRSRPSSGSSTPHLIKLLDQGTIPHHKVGTHRRIRIEDLFAYGEQRETTRREKLDELTRISEELPGGYR